ncbi:prevent-host-death protein [bacterium]|nr:prevent-host-death protein [bacterium]
MLTISKSKLKTHMLRIFREIEKSNEEIIVTDHGKPVLKICPIRKQRDVRQVFADVQGRINFIDDVTSPTTDEWDIV